MKDKLVTLIGGGGFLGRYVAQALFKAGARVRVAQRDPRRAWFLKPLGGLGQTQFVAADVRKPETIARAVHGADAVVNLVGIMSGDMEGSHVAGARTVAEACAAAGISAFVHVSAIGADVEAQSRYGRTKGEGEAAVRAAFPNATIMRPSLIFGREDQFTNRFATMIATATALPLIHVVPIIRPDMKMQPVFVADVAAAIVAALREPDRFGGRTMELGGPDTLTMRELLHWIADETHRTPSFVELPDAVAGMIAGAGFLPCAPITRDQWLMLQRDNVAAADADGLAAFGIKPTPMAAVAPGWLVRFRRHGRFGATDRSANLERADEIDRAA